MLQYEIVTHASTLDKKQKPRDVPDERDTRFARFAIYAILIAAAFISVAYAYYYMLMYPLSETQIWIHNKVIEGTAPKPIQYRILSYYLVEAAHRITGMSILRLDLIVRFIFTSLSLIYFHRYMRRWFDFSASTIGSLIVAVLLPITYIDYMHQPHDVPNFFFTILALMLIRDRREAWLILLIPIAMLNRESFIFVFWAWFFYNFGKLPGKMLIIEFMLFAILALVIYFALPYYFGPRAAYVGMLQLKTNLTPEFVAKWVIRLLAFAGPLFIIGCFRFRSKPIFLKRSLGYVAVYMIVNFFVAMYNETRLFLPVLPVLVPFGLATVFPAYDPDLENRGQSP